MKIYVTKFSKYIPSPENPGEQPKLEYVDPLFRRRLSQLTRMTIEVLHDLSESGGEELKKTFFSSKLTFASFRGEIARQLKINKGLVEDAAVLPAPFSLSVFNTPPAAATIALGMKAGYTAIYPSEDNFLSAFIAASGTILSGSEKSVIFAYADEKIPEEYKNCKNYIEESPLAFACLLSSTKIDGAIEVSLEKADISQIASSPINFLTWLESNWKN